MKFFLYESIIFMLISIDHFKNYYLAGSFPFVDLDAALLKRGDDESFVVL